MEAVMSQQKQELRDKILAKLLSLTKEELKRRSENVEKILSELPLYRKAKLIMAYYPLRGEVDLRKMIGKGFDCKRFCFPVMDLKKKDLRVFEANNLEGDFILGAFGVWQPDPTKAKEIDPKEIDLVIVPGLAFDLKRSRLGRGAGFYDRFLKRIKSPTQTFGVGFEFQILKNLPTHLPFDEKVDFVVSEKSVIQ